MKITIWDILAIVTLFAVVVVVILFIMIFANPYTVANPFPPPTIPPRVVLPTLTPTLRSLPATWTPAPGGSGSQNPNPDAPEPVVFVATSTPPPTATGFTLPTFTPTLTPTPTRTVDKALWIKQSPVDGAILSPGQDFDMTWTIKNIGANSWTQKYSFAYARGANIHKQDRMTLNRPVGVDETVDLVVDMVAPNEPGEYSTAWRLINDTGRAFYTVTFVFTIR
ncbi:MAG: NBR1-Ig-like domain-containing protein [Anaerolineaceae bacterium]|jgi:hypothetical protein